MQQFKISFLQYISIISILILNSIIFYVFYNDIAMRLLSWELSPSFAVIFATFVSYYVFLVNLRPPYVDYMYVEEDEFDEAFAQECYAVKMHVIIGAVSTLLVCILMKAV